MSENPNKSYEFTLELLGPDVTDEEHFDVLSEATDDSALFSRRGESQFADFDLEASSFPEAVITAISQLDDLLPDLRVVRVQPEDLVNASEIARRTGRSRQSISQLIKGQRGPGGFPVPQSLAGSSSPLWSWSDVTRWFADQGEEVSEEPLMAEFVAMVNGALDAREHSRRLKEQAEQLRRHLAEVEAAARATGLRGRRRRQKAEAQTHVVAEYERRRTKVISGLSLGPLAH
jgi:predicted DNA-binding transcriptional regulator AlpA